MAIDSKLDPATGLLHRTAFLAEVRKSESLASEQSRRGCLLILHFPVLAQIRQAAGAEAAEIGLRNLLAIVETRHRSRDEIGRIGEHSLCILLRRCKELHAKLIADQYEALLRDVIIEASSHTASMDLLYRIVPLDWRGQRKQQGYSKRVKAPENAAQVVTAIKALASASHLEQATLFHLPSKSKRPLSLEQCHLQTAKVTSASYRLRPGMLLQNRDLICCYRLLPVGILPPSSPIPECEVVNAALEALSMGVKLTRPRIERQLIVPVDAAYLNLGAAQWLKSECHKRKIAPADLCLHLQLNALVQDARAVLPGVRSLNRHGVQLMLEGLSTKEQYTTGNVNLVEFDYLLLSAKALHSSLRVVRVRQELMALIHLVHEQQRQICSAGVDSRSLKAHAQGLQIDIGFGRECGKSLAFD